jgi:hypothetical protein
MKQIEWMDKYTKKEIVNGLKNLANPTRTKGGRVTTIEEISVVRKGYMIDDDYNHIYYQPISKIKDGTDMSNYQLTIDDIKYSWGDLNKLSIGLLRYKAFRAGLVEENMDVMKC